MGSLMDLVAGESREILLALAVDDLDGLADRGRFDAHLSLGGGLDPTWLDLFAEAVRAVTGRDEPGDFLDARTELDAVGDGGERIVERVSAEWVEAVAQVPETHLDALAGRWIDLLEGEFGLLPREEKPWIRDLAARIVHFSRAASGARDVIFAWSF